MQAPIQLMNVMHSFSGPFITALQIMESVWQCVNCNFICYNSFENNEVLGMISVAITIYYYCFVLIAD